MVLLLLSGLGFDGLTLVLVVAVVVVAWRGGGGVLVDDVGCGSRCVCGWVLEMNDAGSGD